MKTLHLSTLWFEINSNNTCHTTLLCTFKQRRETGKQSQQIAHITLQSGQGLGLTALIADVFWLGSSRVPSATQAPDIAVFYPPPLFFLSLSSSSAPSLPLFFIIISLVIYLQIRVSTILFHLFTDLSEYNTISLLLVEPNTDQSMLGACVMLHEHINNSQRNNSRLLISLLPYVFSFEVAH